MAEKNYRSATSVDEFYYGVLDEDTNTATEVERIKYLQEITVEMEQEIEKAYGDSVVAELAIAAGEVVVESQFHTLPIEDRQTLLGFEESGGLVATGGTDITPYVSVVFARTFEDGSKEYVGLPKGLFTRPSIEGQTKEDSVEFSSSSISAEFMDREVEGFDDAKSVVFARDEADDTANRDALFQAIFGAGHPDSDGA